MEASIKNTFQVLCSAGQNWIKKAVTSLCTIFCRHELIIFLNWVEDLLKNEANYERQHTIGFVRTPDGNGNIEFIFAVVEVGGPNLFKLSKIEGAYYNCRLNLNDLLSSFEDLSLIQQIKDNCFQQ